MAWTSTSFARACRRWRPALRRQASPWWLSTPPRPLKCNDAHARAECPDAARALCVVLRCLDEGRGWRTEARWARSPMPVQPRRAVERYQRCPRAEAVRQPSRRILHHSCPLNDTVGAQWWVHPSQRRPDSESFVEGRVGRLCPGWEHGLTRAWKRGTLKANINIKWIGFKLN